MTIGILLGSDVSGLRRKVCGLQGKYERNLNHRLPTDLFASVARLVLAPTITGALGSQRRAGFVVEFSLASFLEGLKIALAVSADFQDGHYTRNPERGVRAFGRVYSSWPYGQSVSNGVVRCYLTI